MPYEIETKDDIVIRGIPDDISPDHPSVKERVTAARSGSGAKPQATPEQQSELAEKVGTKRAEITDAIVTNPNWHTLSDESKIKMLGKIYEKGLDYGKSVFYLKNKDSLKEKPQKAGFQTP